MDRCSATRRTDWKDRPEHEELTPHRYHEEELKSSSLLVLQQYEHVIACIV